MQTPKKPRRAPRIAGLALLALICIAGAELLVCRFVAYDLYLQITAPVSAFTREIAEQGKALFASVAAAGAEAIRPDPPVSQAISEPETEDPPPVEDPKVTEFLTRQDREVLTGGIVELVYYHQGEDPWAQGSYGPDPIAGYACGPTVMAMLVSSLTEELLDPIQSAQAAYEAGYCAPGSGSYLSIVEGMADDYGLTAVPFENWSADALCRELASGQLFVALMGPGHFTNGGHFIILRGITLEGKVLVADPNSRERSLAAWDPQLILDELSASRSNGAPLWRFSSLDPTR